MDGNLGSLGSLGSLGELARLRHYVTGLTELREEYERAVPEHSEGTDRSGMVRAELGRDGLPETIRVSSMWQDRLGPESFCAAVTSACQAATQARDAERARTLERAGWRERMDRLDADSEAAAQADPDAVRAAFRRDIGNIRPRPVELLAEEVIRALDVATAAARARSVPARGTGTNPGSTLAITVSEGGRVSCQADARWVAQRTGAQLGEALSVALAAARRDLAAAQQAARPDDAAAGLQLDRLMAETLAALNDLARPQQR